MSESPAQATPRWLTAGVLLVALCWRVLGLQTQSLSMDELYELGLSRSSPGEILVAQDGFPPLYHYILHGWFNLFPAAASARWLSVILGTAAVWIIMRIAHQQGNRLVGAWTGLLVALAPLPIWHAQEGRAYVLFYLLAACALWAFYTALRIDRRGSWLAYAAVALLGLSTHYHFALLVLTNVSLLVLERGFRPSRPAVMAHILLAVGALPLLWLLQGDLSIEKSAPFATDFHPAAAGYTLFSFFSGYGLGPSPRELHGMPAPRAFIESLPWLLLIAGAGGILVLRGLRVLGVRIWLPRLLVGTVLPVVLLVFVAGLAGVTFQVRHVLWASIPLMVVLGAGCSAWRGRPLIGAATLLLLVLFLTSRYNRIVLPRYQNEDLRGLAGHLRSTNSHIPVFVLSGYMAPPVQYYLGDEWKVVALPDVTPIDGPGPALRTMHSVVEAGQPFWLVYTREFHGDPGGRLVDSLARLHHVQRIRDFPGVALYAGDRGSAKAGPF